MQAASLFKSLTLAASLSVGAMLSTGLANAAVVHPANIPGTTITVVPSDFIDSASQLKSEFGNLGDADVLAAMKTAPWFGTSNITALANVASGNCNAVGSLTTCSETPVKSGTYTGTASTADDGNLFVIHIGGSGGGYVLAYLYDYYFNNFSVSGFANGVSWIRAYNAPDFIRNQGPDPVPLPGAAILLISGLAGLGALGRLRAKKA